MKKKLICILLCAVTTLSLIGCGSSETKDAESAKTDTASVSNSNSTDQKDAKEDDTKKEDTKKEDTKKDVKEESKVLFEDEFAKITYTGIDREGMMGPEIKVEIENKSDKALTIQSRDVSVDGYMVDPAFSSDVLQGKKSKESLTFLSSDVDKNFKAVEGKFVIMPKDDFATILKEEPFKITY